MSHARHRHARSRTKAVLRTGLHVAATVALALSAVRSDAASLYDPAYRFSTVSSDHFVIYYHQGEYRLATRLAGIAEDAWRALQRSLRTRPPQLTHVVLIDQTELANGSAFPLPYNTIVITAVWPAGSDFIGNTDDWLRLVFTHELTHIVHLDRSEGWAHAVRGIFGRVPVAFPNLFLPVWHIEGLATYEESVITGEGRLHAGDFRAIVGEAARERRLEPLDRVNGGLTDWPGGLAPYAYGLGFHAYLAERYGEDKFAALADATAQRVPYTASRVFHRVYGQSLGTLWRSYEESLAQARVNTSSTGGERQLTHHGFTVVGPRFTRWSCGTCPTEVIYSVRTPHDFPSLNRVTLDGAPPLRIATRYLGSTVAIGRQTIYFDQQEVRRNTGVYGDLYALDRASGRVRQITTEARLLDPDMSPDEQTLVAVQDRPGQRDLVLVRLQSGHALSKITEVVTLVSGPEIQFNAPRWSPDGRSIAVERHVLGAQSEVAIVDVATRAVRTLAADPKARWATPAWRPDGRAIVAASDRDGPFNLYEVDVDGTSGARQLTYTSGGATWPDVSPDGTTIVYVGYAVDGFDLFQMPYPDGIRDSGLGVRPSEPRIPTPGSPVPTPDSQPPTPDYSPLPTLRPTSWSPSVTGDRTQIRVGATTSGVDVLGYHAYSASATWSVLRPADAPAVTAATPDWQLSYAYGRWRPTLFAAASSDTSFFAGPPSDAGLPSTTTLRERQLQAGVLFPMRHTRVASSTLVSALRAVDDFTFSDHDLSRNRTAIRVGWSMTSAHTYGYSISPEEGAAVGLTTELVERALGSSGDATTSTLDARAYLPGFAAHQVIAIRFAGGTSSGDSDIRRTFLLGGAGPDLETIDFGRQAINLLRGFPINSFAGSKVALANAEYRWPIGRPQRGIGTWPLLLHTVHAAVFADAGHAWTHSFRLGALKTSIGGELSLDVVAGYSVPFTVTAGVAWGHDASRTVRDHASVYFRVGRAF